MFNPIIVEVVFKNRVLIQLYKNKGYKAVFYSYKLELEFKTRVLIILYELGF